MDQWIVWKIAVTFLGGILSVFSPCVLPILPGFIAYFSGLTLEEAKHKRKRTVIASIFFSLGFMAVFMAFGILANGISAFLIINQVTLQRIGGIIIIIFGLIQIGLLKFTALQRDYKIEKPISKTIPIYLSSFLIGVLFAFSWAPCYGPIIGAILTYTATSQTFWLGFFYFIVYALGFTLPIILIALFLDQLSRSIRKHRALFRYTTIISGILLIIIGLLMLTNELSTIVNFINIIYTQNRIMFF